MSDSDDNKAPRPPSKVSDDPNDEIPTKNVFQQNQEDINKVAAEVLAGQWGEGEDRRNRLRQAGFDHRQVRAAMAKIVQG